MKIVVALVSLCVASPSYSAKVVTVCKLGAQTSSCVELIRDRKIASTHIYFVRQAGKRMPLFGTAELSRGSDVVAQCVGTRQRALILSREFTANAARDGLCRAYFGSRRAQRQIRPAPSYPSGNGGR